VPLTVSIADSGTVTEENRAFLELLYERDNPFPAIDYRVFAQRQGRAD